MADGPTDRTAVLPRDVPMLVRFLGKLVLEVMPAALASVIGGALFTHYQFGQPPAPRPAAEMASLASADMVQLVREEHALLRDYLNAQQLAERSRAAEADAQDARAVTQARMAESVGRRAIADMAAAKPPEAPRHSAPAIVAA